MPSESVQIVYAEILEVLTATCQTHKLPLAQAWFPCRRNTFPKTKMNDNYGNLSGLSESDIGLCTREGQYFLNNPGISGFRKACNEHCLEKEQGVPGKAFVSNHPFFSCDIKVYSKSEYPLVHYARVFRLGAAVAIRLRSVHTGHDDYVLEFFLPQGCSDFSEQQLLLNTLSITMQRVCRSLRTVTEEEIEIESVIQVHALL